ncbi:Dinucleoside triphosphate hydrolase [Podospora pseudopauciseta]|uniref:Dinucleoside triphosphate hydrolase n=1 Tax=Podospora pseudopauciseta TaxID=2093780 RepID=A0ABR0H4F2_9PEZI|nr:Dinucleoside triphosphate hydrolase [Podospora pseudopauciseta]
MLSSRASKLKPFPGVYSHCLLSPGTFPQQQQQRLLHQKRPTPPPPPPQLGQPQRRPTLTTFPTPPPSLSRKIPSLKMSTTPSKSSPPPTNITFGPYPIPHSQIFLLTPLTFALVNLKPLLPGHVLVCPIYPHKRLTSLSQEELLDLWSTVQKVQVMLARHYFPSPGAPEQGSFNIAVQDGQEAGQTVPHVHVHVIPRIRGVTEKGGDGAGDELYERMAGEEGNVGGALWDKENGCGGERPVGRGNFDRIEDAERMAREAGDMQSEAEVYKRVLEEMERDEVRDYGIENEKGEKMADDVVAGEEVKSRQRGVMGFGEHLILEIKKDLGLVKQEVEALNKGLDDGYVRKPMSEFAGWHDWLSRKGEAAIEDEEPPDVGKLFEGDKRAIKALDRFDGFDDDRGPGGWEDYQVDYEFMALYDQKYDQWKGKRRKQRREARKRRAAGWETFISNKPAHEPFFDEDENFSLGHGSDVDGSGKDKTVLIRILNEKKGVSANWHVNFEALTVDEDVQRRFLIGVARAERQRKLAFVRFPIKGDDLGGWLAAKGVNGGKGGKNNKVVQDREQTKGGKGGKGKKGKKAKAK